MGKLAKIYFALLSLLALTALLSQFSLGKLGLVLSLLIAVTKAILVLLYFMNLSEKPKRLYFFALGSLVWLVFLFSITLSDYFTRGMLGIPGK